MCKFTKLSIGWSEGSSKISQLIKRLDGGRFSHVFLLFASEDLPELIYESHFRGGVQVTPYSQLTKAMIDGRVTSRRLFGLSDDPATVAAIWDSAAIRHGSGYDATLILFYYVWIRVMRRSKKASTKLFSNGKYTCNEFVIKTCQGFLEPFENLDVTFTPERLYQHFIGEPSR